VRGKGDRERLVPLSPSLARRLKRFGDRARGEASSDRLFLTLRRGRESGKLDAITESAVEQMIRALGEVAGIKKRVYPHLVRHSFATDYLRRGGNPILLQQILGHTSLAMITQTYQRVPLCQTDRSGAVPSLGAACNSPRCQSQGSRQVAVALGTTAPRCSVKLERSLFIGLS
jgi:integrase/recombinase XerD